jgi:hypothetical protein
MLANSPYFSYLSLINKQVKACLNKDYLLSDLDRIDKVHIKAITQLEEAGCDLVKRHWFFAAYWYGRREERVLIDSISTLLVFYGNEISF